jgi:hypothetical protein
MKRNGGTDLGAAKFERLVWVLLLSTTSRECGVWVALYRALIMMQIILPPFQGGNFFNSPPCLPSLIP